MATSQKNLSNYNRRDLPDAGRMRIGIVVSNWNSEITDNLLNGARSTLLDAGLLDTNILVHRVPGSFELPIAAQWMLESKEVDGAIVLGSVIQGETRHFDFVCQAVANAVQDVNLKTGKPIIFGLLTDDNIQQARDRSGGKHGNKGVECAVAAIQMVALQKEHLTA